MSGKAPPTGGTRLARPTIDGADALRGSFSAPQPHEPPPPALAGTRDRVTQTVVAVVVLLFAGLFLVDVLTPTSFRPHTVLVLIPIASALFASFRATAATVVTAVGLIAVLKAIEPGAGWTLANVSLITACSGLALLVACIRARETRRFDSVSAIADATQRAVMRRMPARIWNLHIASDYRPAVTAARVGGDWFDVQPSPHGLRAVLGDVSGHGLASVGASSALMGEFRSSGYFEDELTEISRRLEITMRRNNVLAEISDDGQELFSTALVLEFGPHHVDIVNHGHEHPLLIRNGTVTELPIGGGLPLGLGMLCNEPTPDPVRVDFLPGDTLLMYTDGVSESRDPGGRFYPLRSRLDALAPQFREPTDLCAAITADLQAFRRGPASDDTALVLIARTHEHVDPFPDANRYLYAPAYAPRVMP